MASYGGGRRGLTSNPGGGGGEGRRREKGEQEEVESRGAACERGRRFAQNRTGSALPPFQAGPAP